MNTFTKSLKTRIATLNIREDDVLQIDVASNENFEELDMQELLNAVYKLGGGKQFKSLVVVGENTLTNVEAMKLCCSPVGCRYKKATAFVINGVAQRLLGSFYMYTLKPSTPTKFFTDKEQAEIWLKNVS
ncbi:MAG TPA: hypothetical protein VNZ49_08355 [Bacteroidia bacterium]|jgi:hypothetical protein|nr:hypothetical protein [Bacteroidia bacterium]